MGEYQCYDFLAIDRPLTPTEQQAVSRLSSRVEPHPWRATFVYHWSDLPADPAKLLAQYYDAMLYMANWGSRRLMFRFPRALLDDAAAQREVAVRLRVGSGVASCRFLIMAASPRRASLRAS